MKASWTAGDGLVHLCFRWNSETLDRGFWSTLCMYYDSLDTYRVIHPHEMVTCVRCLYVEAHPHAST